jgi:glycosyltransferase involved in cell wall biosynthesis
MNGKSCQMHIVMVTNAIAPDKLGGLERYVRELSKELVRQGHAVTVISKMTSPDQPDVQECPDGVKVMRYKVPLKEDTLFAVKYPYYVMRGVREALGAALRTSYPGGTAVHGHFPLPMLPLVMKRIPYVYTCHAPVYKEILDERQGSYRFPQWALGILVGCFKLAERRVLKTATRVVTLSQFVSQEVCDLTRQNPDTITRIPGGLDTGWFSPLAEDEGQRTSPGPLIFTARRLVSRTGVEELLRAMPLILEHAPTAKLAVAGDGPLRPRLQKVIVELGLGHSVSLLGRISEVELREWYRKADIAVTPTRNLEGFGLSTVEAMACGTVPLVTPVAANPEVVRHVSPLLIAPGVDARGIADGIMALWTSAEFESLCSTVRGAVHPQLSWPSVCREYLSVYREAAGRRPALPKHPAADRVAAGFDVASPQEST